jgi:hypothetical protein
MLLNDERLVQKCQTILVLGQWISKKGQLGYLFCCFYFQSNMGRVFIFCFYFQQFKNITQTSSILLLKFWFSDNAAPSKFRPMGRFFCRTEKKIAAAPYF